MIYDINRMLSEIKNILSILKQKTEKLSAIRLSIIN
jgi:hypothetical protein